MCPQPHLMLLFISEKSAIKKTEIYMTVCLKKAIAAGNTDKRALLSCYLLLYKGIDKRAGGKMHIYFHQLYCTTVTSKVSVEASGENNNYG